VQHGTHCRAWRDLLQNRSGKASQRKEEH
jgi:hypothetical protein